MQDVTGQRANITGSIRDLFQHLDAWAKSADDFVTERLERAVERTLEIVAESRGFPGVQELSAFWPDMQAAWALWKETGERTQIYRYLPEDDFWAMLAKIPAAMVHVAYPPPNPLEPIEQLWKALENSPGGVNQICRMYGFQHPDTGEPFAHWVPEELKNPGCHTSAESGWKHPLLKRREAAHKEDVERMAAVLAACEAKKKRLTAACRETLEQLIEAGVYLPQICRMLHKSAEEIRAECQAKGLPLPQDGPRLQGLRSAYEKPLTDDQARQYEAEASVNKPRGSAAAPAIPTSPSQRAAADPFADAILDSGPAGAGTAAAVAADGAMSLDERIVNMHLGGTSAKEIAKQLAGEGVGEKRVKAAIQRYEENPELFVGG